GTVRVIASDVAHRTAASSTRTVLQHGDLVTVDLALTDTLLPIDLADANGFTYHVNADSTLGRGAATEGYQSAYKLSIATRGVASSLASVVGDFAATPDLGARQSTIRNFGASLTPQPLAGLIVSRKIFVPSSGYFARYLEILDNPSSSPLTVDVLVESILT